MGLRPEQIDAVLFDYGNTLIEFTHDQIEASDRALAEELRGAFGPFDEDRYRRIRAHDRRAPYGDGFHERPIDAITAEMVRALYDVDPTPKQLASLVMHRYEHFVASIVAPPGVDALLARLSERFKLGLVSNYPCGQSVRDSLARNGLAAFFDGIVVSAEVGRVKPHPLPFEAALEQLGVAPGRALYVGDNWFGDVQGAKRLGMQAVHTTQYDTPEKFDRQPDDHDADLTIDRLDELSQHL